MKAKPYRWDDTEKAFYPCQPAGATHVQLHFPGPSGYLRLPVVLGNTTRAGSPCWSWNGDTEKPTLKPSIKTTSHQFLCHTWVNAGRVQFLSDCSHEFRGQTLDLLDVDL